MISSSVVVVVFFITCCWFSSFNAFIYSKPRWHVSCGCSNNSSFDECRKINENVTLNSFNCLFRAHIKREIREREKTRLMSLWVRIWIEYALWIVVNANDDEEMRKNGKWCRIRRPEPSEWINISIALCCDLCDYRFA